MAPTLALSDQVFAEELVAGVDQTWVRSTFQGRYGRGWQRKLAHNLGIAESTMSGWLKSGEIPEWAKLAMGALVLRDNLSSASAWRPVRAEHGYAVYAYEDKIGRLKADRIPSPADAFLIAAAPALYEACAEAFVVMDDADFEFWQDIVQRLRDALDAAKPEGFEGHLGNQEAEA